MPSTEDKDLEDLSLDLIKDYFEEAESLLRDLSKGKEEILNQKIKYDQYNEAKYKALMISTQKILDIIHFEIFFMESKYNYENFQLYSTYRDKFIDLCNEFLQFQCVFDSAYEPNKTDKNIQGFEKDKSENNESNGILNNLSNKNNIHRISQNYLNQGKRLLEETNQYGQQVLLNLNTQREQLEGANSRINIISQSLNDSSLLLDKMSKWWHKII